MAIYPQLHYTQALSHLQLLGSNLLVILTLNRNALSETTLLSETGSRKQVLC